MSNHAVRYEHDLLGIRAVPAEAYHGVDTLRALENFPITGTPISIYPDLVNARACVKQAAALANNELGLVDVIQGGAGTSTNLSANEVIANLALEAMGRAGSSIMPRKVNPVIPEVVNQIAQEALSTGMSVYDLMLEKKLLGKAQLDEVFRPEVLTLPRATHPLQQTGAAGDAA